jgi:energy-coupling factor transporter ATP-binding protein EcfA2
MSELQEDDDPQQEYLKKIKDQLFSIPHKIDELQKLNAAPSTSGNTFSDAETLSNYQEFFIALRKNIQVIIKQLQGTQTEINLMPPLDDKILDIALNNVPQAKNLATRMAEGRPIRALLHGPAGTGKSTLACAIAKKVQEEDKTHNRPERPIIFRNAALIKNSMQYCVEDAFKQLIEPYVRSGKPAIVIIDEIDALGGNTKEELLSQSKALNGLISAQSQVSFIVTANNTQIIDETLLSRFKRDQILVDLPKLECRKQILQYHLEHADGFSLTPEVNEQAIEDIAKRMNGRSGRDIESLVEHTLGLILQKPNKTRIIALADIKKALGTWSPSMGQKIGTFSRAAIARTGEFLGNNWQCFTQLGLSSIQHKWSMEQSEQQFQASQHTWYRKLFGEAASGFASHVGLYCAEACMTYVLWKLGH